MKDKPDPKIIEQINYMLLKKVEAANNHDAAAFAGFFTEDAVYVSADRGPLYGRDAIEKYYADLFKVWQPKNYTSKRDPNSPRFIGTVDNIASNGEWRFTVQSKTGEDIQIKGYWSSIVTRENDGWKIRMVTVNVTPPPPEPAQTK